MGARLRPRIVVSGVNLVEAGPLAVFKDALSALADHFADEFDLIALVYRRDLFDLPQVRLIEFPDVKSSWIRRLHFEYFLCRQLSRDLDAHLWLSMHDITPNVKARRQAVYCHNPAPFYKLPWREALLDPRFAVFHWMYPLLYRFRIARNDFVIVQQQWIRDEFQRRFPVRQVIVAHPSPPGGVAPAQTPFAEHSSGTACGPAVFFYPAFARCFKNAQVLLEAVAALEAQDVHGFEVWLTLSGRENRYARSLLRRFGHLNNVRWLGSQPRERVEELYAEASCLVFPSKLETWGMPISEFKRTGKQMLIADLPYAHETTGNYDRVEFFAPGDSRRVAELMRGVIDGTLHSIPATAVPIPQPFAPGWSELFRLLLKTGASEDPIR